MYAIVESSGFQYSVSEGDIIQVPRVDADVGAAHELDKVLLVSGEDTPLVGKPYVEGASVKTKVINHSRHDKVLVFKFKRRVKYRKLRGHRQGFTELKIDKIVVS
ncbi:MAG: 50S ribosomal protein L21 [candidate division Zixibacteria bacterium]|nr:50S ribosomal protein L21 [candidate division Zixibacteria bacterium]